MSGAKGPNLIQWDGVDGDQEESRGATDRCRGRKTGRGREYWLGDMEAFLSFNFMASVSPKM